MRRYLWYGGLSPDTILLQTKEVQMLRQILFKLKTGTEEQNYGRESIVEFAKTYASNVKNPQVVDLGAGHGTDLLNVQAALGKGHYLAVESYAPYRKELKALGIESFKLNIESQKLPFDDSSVDVVIANQIIEHTKEIFFIFSEIHRVLKPGGVAIIGVPNLASFHNRLALLFGAQPTSIELYSAHVRGITAGSFRRFIEKGGFFKLAAVRGANFYPFPVKVSKNLAKLFPTASVGLMLCIQKTKKGDFISILDDTNFETPFFRG